LYGVCRGPSIELRIQRRAQGVAAAAYRAVIAAQGLATPPYGKNKLASRSDPGGEWHLHRRF